MLEDPDALLKNATIQKIIADGAQASDLEVVEGQYLEVSKPAEAQPEKEGPGKGAEGASKSGEGGGAGAGAAGKAGGGGKSRQKEGNNGPSSGIY